VDWWWRTTNHGKPCKRSADGTGDQQLLFPPLSYLLTWFGYKLRCY
jgi:hypothetical protein